MAVPKVIRLSSNRLRDLLIAAILLLLLAQNGWPALRALAFPLGFLLFMAPFPTAVMEWIEATLQHRSAASD